MNSSLAALFPPPKDCYFYTNDDGTVTVPTAELPLADPEALVKTVKEAMNAYEWRDSDVLLATYPKNGTHFMWEIMTMLQRGTADYIKESKAVLMFDLLPINEPMAVAFPSPRVLNSHLRLDVLPKQFRGRKTVCVMRNPKDTLVSLYYHKCKTEPKMFPDSERSKQVANVTVSDLLLPFLNFPNMPYGSYFGYTEYMWSLRDDPNMLIVFFEDLKRDPTSVIQKVNEFMGTNRSAELVEQIADATNINKMREAKISLMDDMDMSLAGGEVKMNVKADTVKGLYRKGEIGDWKNHFTVAMNEIFDAYLEKWTGGKDIPFQYE